MSFPTIKVTDAGRLLLSKVLAGASVEFTKFVLGEGACPNSDDWGGLTGPIYPVMTCNITKFSRVEDKVVLQGEFSNANVPKAFLWHELCVFGHIPDEEDSTEVMIFYGNAGGLAEYVPGPDSAVAVTHRWDTTVTLSSSANVSAMVQSITYATIEQLNAHIGDTANPHKVTKEQVGLGQVENYAPNDIPVSFDEIPTEVTQLQSGEPIWRHVARIARAIIRFIAHLRDYENPHQVSPEQIKAAPEAHSSSNATYGIGNGIKYGHVKLTNLYSGGEGPGDGVALTPSGLKSVIGRNCQYTGAGHVTNGDNSIVHHTNIKVSTDTTNDPAFVFIHGATYAVIGHHAMLSVVDGKVSGISNVDGMITQISGTYTNGKLYLAADAVDATAENQMNAPGETYICSAVF